MLDKELRQTSRNGAVKTWNIRAEGNSATTTWGQLDGAMQETTQTFEGVNIGKANEKTPEEVTEAWALRQILMKTRKGFVEVSEDGEWTEENKEFTGFSDIPENLRWYKPLNNLNAKLRKLLNANGTKNLRKRNGNMHFISTGDNKETIYMYSSTTQRTHKDEPTMSLMARYPQIRRDLDALDLPEKTILLGELVTTHKDEFGFEIDDLEYVSGIRGSLRDTAMSEQKKHGELGFCVWDIAFYGGKNLLEEYPFEERWGMLQGIKDAELPFVSIPDELTFQEDEGGNIVAVINGETTFDDLDTSDLEKAALSVASTLGWEGFVIVSPNELYGDKAFNFRGKPERPPVVGKLKPDLEGDFIVRYDPDNGIGVKGKGRKSVGIGSVQTYLLDHDGNEVPVSLVGGGLTTVDKDGIEADITKYANPALYPMVWQIEFKSWTKKGSLQHPNFLCPREDKTPEECSITQNPEWETTEWQS